MLHTYHVATAVLGMLLEANRGISGTAHPKQPPLPIQLYDFEACPYCRRVREVLTMLNLDVEILPCPKNGTRFRPQAKKLTGIEQFPLLVDDNTGVVLHESQDIIDYLFATYGETGQTPKKWQALPKTATSQLLVTAVRPTKGLKAKPSNRLKDMPAKMLELWSFEASPFTRLVRERLCELELPYLLRNVAKERWQDIGPAVLRLKPGKYEPLAGGKRAKLLQEVGKVQMPYLIDPNTGVNMHESKAILAYLNKQYA